MCHIIIIMFFFKLLEGNTQVGTHVWHNLEQHHLVEGHEEAGSYMKVITYSASIQQIIALIDNSIMCKQHIRLKCYGSALKDDIGEWYYWWQNRHGITMYNWGSPKGTYGCDCSTRNGMIRHFKIALSMYKNKKIIIHLL